MMKAQKPANESERLAALREYHILDTAAELSAAPIETGVAA